MKKKSAGIIAEYNPFHNGHLYHLKETKSATGADVVVAAMSGNFLQRGQMAVCDKWGRALAAVKNGVDLVVEIPVVFACNSAPLFASSAVEILENLGIEWLSFGSESGNISRLKEISREIKERKQEIEEAVKEKTKEGMSYPRARREVVYTALGEEKALLLDSPNNILAIEYLSSIRRAKAVTVKRQGPGYNDTEVYDGIASATAIRTMLKEGRDVKTLIPACSEEMISNSPAPDQQRLFQLICQKALTSSSEELDSVFAGGEGLGNKLKNIIRTVSSLDELSEGLKSKRYTKTRIDRFLIHTLLEIKAPENYRNYIRVLAFNERGSSYLKEVKKAEISKLPIITNINKEIKNHESISSALEKDILASDLYNLVSGRDLYKHSDYVTVPALCSENVRKCQP